MPASPQDLEQHLHAMIRAALHAVDPLPATARCVLNNPPVARRPAVIAVGKAASRMYAGYAEVRAEPAARLMIAPEGVPVPGWAILSDHPLPGERSREAGEALHEFVNAHLGAGDGPDGFVVLLSGGASALTTLPEPPLEVESVGDVTNALLLAGTPIHELNCVRKHIDRLKGGKLSALMAPLPCDVYVLSDVIGDDPSVIASGPCAPDPTFYVDALAIAQRALAPKLRHRFPADIDEETREALQDLYAGHDVLEFLRDRYRDGRDETPKPGDPIFARVRHLVVASNRTAVDAAAEEAARLGYRVAAKSTGVQGEAAEVGRGLAISARELVGKGPACIIAGGETTVTVSARGGKGGRNQEFALAAAIGIDGVPSVAIATFATDGVDGPTDGAGAIVTGETCARARALGLDPRDFLERHDSNTFFARVGGHIRTGPTGTNVNDLAIALVYG